MKKKTVMLVAAIAMILCLAIGGTLAYFTDTTDEFTNTFTVGKVDIALTETSDEADGIVGTAVYAEDQETLLGYDYENMVPGSTYAKKPVITVAPDSQDAWVFAELTVTNYNGLHEMLIADGYTEDEFRDLGALMLKGADDLADGRICGAWMEGSEFHMVYSFGVKEAEDEITLFTGITVPEKLDKAFAEFNGSDLLVKAYAVQAENVDEKTAYAEWFKASDDKTDYKELF